MDRTEPECIQLEIENLKRAGRPVCAGILLGSDLPILYDIPTDDLPSDLPILYLTLEELKLAHAMLDSLIKGREETLRRLQAGEDLAA